MEEKIKQRLIGVLVLIGVLFIILPFLFHNSRPSADTALSSAAQNASTASTVSVTLPVNSATVTATNGVTNNAASTVAAANPAVTAQPASTQTAQSSTQNKIAANGVAATSASGASNSNVFSPDQSVSSSSGLTTGAPSGSSSGNTAIVPPTTLSTMISAPPSTQQPIPVKVKQASALPKHAATLQPTHAWTVQLAVFSDENNAKELMTKLRARQFETYSRHILRKTQVLTAVFVGPEINKAKSEAVAITLKQDFNLNGEVRKYQS